MSAPTLRNYQSSALDLIDAAFATGKRAPLLVLPTGAGKTVVAAEAMRRANAQGKRAIFITPRRELVKQASGALMRAGLFHGLILAGVTDRSNAYALASVASIDTLSARMVRSKRLTIPDPDLLVIDEAHLSITTKRQQLFDLWPNARRIGLTATPTRKDGAALGILFDELIEGATVAGLTAQGVLAPARYFSLAAPDLARVRITAGDFNAADLEEAINRPELVADVVTTWLARAADRRTVVFATSIAHSAALAEEFLRAGVAAEHVDAGTPQDQRDETFARFSSGRTQILTNCFLASYGFDLPALSCVVLARPTKSLMLYLQMIGRGLRAADGKSDCLVLDHAGNVHRHGFAADEREWTLEGDFALVQRDGRDPRTPAAHKSLTCPECSAVFQDTRTCPECRYHFAPKGKAVRTLDGELVEIGAGMEPEDQDKLKFFAELRGYGVEKQFKATWAAVNFREKFGEWPPRWWNDVAPAQPSQKTRGWIQSRLIAWARSRERAQA